MAQSQPYSLLRLGLWGIVAMLLALMMPNFRSCRDHRDHREIHTLNSLRSLAVMLHYYHEDGGQIRPHVLLESYGAVFDYPHFADDCRDGWRNPIRMVRLPDGNLAVMSSGPNGRWEGGDGDDISEALEFLADE